MKKQGMVDRADHIEEALCSKVRFRSRGWNSITTEQGDYLARLLPQMPYYRQAMYEKDALQVTCQNLREQLQTVQLDQDRKYLAQQDNLKVEIRRAVEEEYSVAVAMAIAQKDRKIKELENKLQKSQEQLSLTKNQLNEAEDKNKHVDQKLYELEVELKKSQELLHEAEKKNKEMEQIEDRIVKEQLQRQSEEKTFDKVDEVLHVALVEPMICKPKEDEVQVAKEEEREKNVDEDKSLKAQENVKPRKENLQEKVKVKKNNHPQKRRQARVTSS